MSGRRDRLGTVREVFARREMDEARRLGRFQATLAQAVEQLELLREHRDGEVQRLRTSGAIAPDRLQNRVAFLARLNAAIEQQERVVEQARHGLEELRRQWLAARRRTKAVDKLGERRRDAEDRAAARRDQHASDEHALRRTVDRDDSR